MRPVYGYGAGLRVESPIGPFRLEFENRGACALRLAAPASVDCGGESIRVGAAVLRLAEGSLRVDAFAWEQGRVTTHGAFADLPLAAVAQLAGTPLPLRSTVTLSGAWNIAAAPRLNGTLVVRRERGDLHAPAPAARDAGEIALGVVPGAEPGRIAADAPLSATLTADLASLRALQPWTGTVVSLDGRVRVDLAASGMRARAPITGAIGFAGRALELSGSLRVVEGRVRVTSAADGTPVAKGSIETVRGICQAFGQRLVITRGRLVFDGPVDNPALDFVALRRNLAVEAGVEGTGTVRLPHVRLTAEPPVPDNEKLAWRVPGRGLDRTSGGDVGASSCSASGSRTRSTSSTSKASPLPTTRCGSSTH